MYECWRRAPHVYLLEISDERQALGRNERNREYHYFTSCKCLCRKFKVPAGHWQAWTLSELRCSNHFSCAFLKKVFFFLCSEKMDENMKEGRWLVSVEDVKVGKKRIFFSVNKIFCDSEKSSCGFSFLERCLLDKWVFGFCRCAQLVCTDIYTEAMEVCHITSLFALFPVVLFYTYHLCNNHPEMKMFPLLKPPNVPSPKSTISLYTCWLGLGLTPQSNINAGDSVNSAGVSAMCTCSYTIDNW